MLHIRLIAVGKLKEQYLRQAADEYIKRLSRYAKLEIIELEDFGGDNSEVREGKLILPHLKGRVVLLDVDGVQMTSAEFADFIDKQSLSASTLTLIIGGSNGVSDEVRERADTRISFSKMTFPHQLFRVISLEQLYRAYGILSGTKYHK